MSRDASWRNPAYMRQVFAAATPTRINVSAIAPPRVRIGKRRARSASGFIFLKDRPDAASVKHRSRCSTASDIRLGSGLGQGTAFDADLVALVDGDRAAVIERELARSVGIGPERGRARSNLRRCLGA